jgi:hypothetical protein
MDLLAPVKKNVVTIHHCIHYGKAAPNRGLLIFYNILPYTHSNFEYVQLHMLTGVQVGNTSPCYFRKVQLAPKKKKQSDRFELI